MGYFGLKFRAMDLRDKLKETVDLAISQEYDSLESVAGMSDETFEGIKAINSTLDSFNEYIEKDAELKDYLAETLQNLKDEMKEMQEKMDKLIEQKA